MRLFVYDMLVNVNVIYYVHVCKQARWASSTRNSAIENLCIIIIIFFIMRALRALMSAWQMYVIIIIINTMGGECAHAF